jgi:hypothetical protein
MLPSSLPTFFLPSFPKGVGMDATDPKIVGSPAFKHLFKDGDRLMKERTPYTAQILTWYRILDAGVPAAFVLDPNASIPKDFYQRANSVAASSQLLSSGFDHWDIWLFNQDSDILEVIPAPPLGINVVYKFKGMYAYLITRGAILRLLPRMLPFNSPVDQKVSYATRAYDIKVVHARSLTAMPPSSSEGFALPEDELKVSTPESYFGYAMIAVIVVTLLSLFFNRDVITTALSSK